MADSRQGTYGFTPDLPMGIVDSRSAVEGGHLGFVLFMFVDFVLLAGVAGAYAIVRSSVPVWPPANLPTSDPLLPFVALFGLAVSAVSLWIMQSGIRRNKPPIVKSFLGLALATSLIFVAALGVHFAELHSAGLAFRSVFGGVYYAVIVTLFMHVVTGAGFLTRYLLRVRHWNRYTRSGNGLVHVSYYFWMLAGFWGVIVSLVYLF